MRRKTVIICCLLCVILTGCDIKIKEFNKTTEEKVDIQAITTEGVLPPHYTETEVIEDEVIPVIDTQSIVDKCCENMAEISSFETKSEISQRIELTKSSNKSVLSTVFRSDIITYNKEKLSNRVDEILKEDFVTSDINNPLYNTNNEKTETQFIEAYVLKGEVADKDYTMYLNSNGDKQSLSYNEDFSTIPDASYGYVEFMKSYTPVDTIDADDYYIVKYKVSDLMQFMYGLLTSIDNNVLYITLSDWFGTLEASTVMGISQEDYASILGDSQCSFYINKETMLLDTISANNISYSKYVEQNGVTYLLNCSLTFSQNLLRVNEITTDEIQVLDKDEYVVR